MLTRLITLIAAVSTLVFLSPAVVFASDTWGNITCGETPHPGCQLWSGQAPQQTPAPP